MTPRLLKQSVRALGDQDPTSKVFVTKLRSRLVQFRSRRKPQTFRCVWVFSGHDWQVLEGSRSLASLNIEYVDSQL